VYNKNMKGNSKLTALEVLTAAGFEKPAEKIGKMRVRIAGIRGIVTPDHLISIPAGVEAIDVVLGDETKEVKLEGSFEQKQFTEAARVALEEKGRKATEAAEKLQEAKRLAREKAVEEAVEKVK
jgi:hypothetical protein